MRDTGRYRQIQADTGRHRERLRARRRHAPRPSGAWRVAHGMADGEPGHMRPGGREEYRAHLPISPCISLYLPVSPCISHAAGRARGVPRPPRARRAGADAPSGAVPRGCSPRQTPPGSQVTARSRRGSTGAWASGVRRGACGAWGAGPGGSMVARGRVQGDRSCTWGAVRPAVATRGSGRPKWRAEVRLRLRAA